MKIIILSHFSGGGGELYAQLKCSKIQHIFFFIVKSGINYVYLPHCLSSSTSGAEKKKLQTQFSLTQMWANWMSGS